MNVSRDHVHKRLSVSLFWKVRQPHVLLGTCHKPMYFLFPLWLNFARAALKISPYLLLLLAFFFLQQSKQFHANGRNVSYVVSMQKLSGVKGKVCSTRESYCTFQLPWRAKKVYLSAVNAAGRSDPTEVQIHQQKGKPDVLISGQTALKKKKKKCTECILLL